jgi:hypothetical protein
MKRLALLGVVVLAGCGSTQTPKPVQPHLARALAQPWRAQADAVAAALAAGDGCLARERANALQTSVIAAVNDRRVPQRFQEPLVSAVNDLAGRITCVPPAPQPAPAAPPPKHGHGHDKPPKHEHHGKGHKK